MAGGKMNGDELKCVFREIIGTGGMNWTESNWAAENMKGRQIHLDGTEIYFPEKNEMLTESNRTAEEVKGYVR